MSQKLATQCEGYLRRDPMRPVCVGYTDPGYQWQRFGTCPAWTDNAEQIASEHKQCENYMLAAKRECDRKNKRAKRKEAAEACNLSKAV
jgi:hypothetical protein